MHICGEGTLVRRVDAWIARSAHPVWRSQWKKYWTVTERLRGEEVLESKLRILMVHSESGWRGGESQLQLLMRGLIENEHTVALAAPSQSEIVSRSSGAGVLFYPLDNAGSMDLKSARRLRHIISEYNPDVIHAHASHAHSAMFLATISAGERPLRVVSRRVSFGVGANPFSRIKYSRGADLYLAVSSGAKDALLRGGVSEDRIRVVFDGIDLDHCKEVAVSQMSTEKTVGIVASLTREKGHADLLRAAALVREEDPHVRFVVVGDGPERKALEKLSAQLGVDKMVTFAGFREDAIAMIATFTCFVLPSHQEGLGTTILNAQAMGTPVVATRVGGIPDIVVDGVTGLLVAPEDPVGLSAAIMRMLVDDDFRAGCVDRARSQSIGYSYQEMVYKTLDAYRTLLKSPSAHPPVKGQAQ